MGSFKLNNMDKEKAIQIFEEVANLAQKNGLLGMQDVPTILQAIQFLKDETTNDIPTT